MTLPFGLGCMPPERQTKVEESVRISPRTHLVSGKMLESQDNLTGAIEQYRRVIAADPHMTVAYHRLGVVYQKAKRPSEAARAFQNGIDADPENASFHNNLGFCRLQEGRYDSAEKSFRTALAISPTFRRARMNLAITLARTNRLGESIDEFSQVLPAEEAYYNVAVIRLRLNDYAKAAWALQQALLVRSDFEPAGRIIDQVVYLARSGRGAPGDESAVVQSAGRGPVARRVVPTTVPLVRTDRGRVVSPVRTSSRREAPECKPIGENLAMADREP